MKRTLLILGCFATALTLVACGNTVGKRAATGGVAGALIAGPAGAVVGGTYGAVTK